MSRHCKVREVACLSLCCRQCPKLERLAECLYTVRLPPSHTCLFLPVVVSLNLLLLFFVFPHLTCAFCSFSLRFFVVYPSFVLNMLSPLLNITIFSIRNNKLVALIFSENKPHLKKNHNLPSSSLEHLPFPNINKLRTVNSIQNFSPSP